MSRKITWLVIPLALLLLCGSALAVGGEQQQGQIGGGYDLSWWTLDGGGTKSSAGGGYELAGSIGQPDAGVLGSGPYTLDGGFWGRAAASVRQEHLLLPLVLK